ncbi:PqqD family protein [Merdimonas faecis]|uniref:PqqD family protein n=1 Tax=Merdimonas faecis TaxID=1653435 RepID=UPI0023F98B48|nr:PqqD family protein [Merdimonas faecis]
MTETAAFIWKQADIASELEGIVERVLQEFEVDEEIAGRDVYGFLRELYVRGIEEDIPEFAGD